MDLLGVPGVPYRALTNFEICDLAKKLKIPNFVGCFMKNELPSNGPKTVESAIVNFETNEMTGSHWCAYRKVDNLKEYFDGYGDRFSPKFVNTWGARYIEVLFKCNISIPLCVVIYVYIG